MGKRQKKSGKWRKIDASSAEKALVEKNEAKQVQSIKAHDLFFTDTSGNIGSQKNRKRRAANRKKDEGEDFEVTFRAPKKVKKKPEPELPVVLDIWGQSDTLAKKRPKKARPHKKMSRHLKAVPMVTSLSANLQPEEHLEALNKAYEADQTIRKAGKELMQKLDGIHPSQQASSAHIPQDPEEEASTYIPSNKMRNKKLTHVERNKLAAKKAKKLQRMEQAKQRQFAKQLKSLDGIVAAVKKEAKLYRKKKCEMEAAPEVIDETAVQLSKHKIPEDFPEFLLTEEYEEANGHLINVAASYNVVEDQFKRFTKKNMIEQRIKQKRVKPKYGKQMVYRNSFKEDKHLFPRRTTKKKSERQQE